MKTKALLLFFALMLVGCGQPTESVYIVRDYDSERDAATAASNIAYSVRGKYINVDASELSMAPFIVDSCYMVLVDAKIKDLRVGDVIATIVSEDSAYLHAVYELHGDYVLTKGTGNPHMDSHRTYDKQLIGRVIPLVLTWEGANDN